MKKAIATMVVVFFATFTFAQKIKEKDVPANVKTTFQAKYPTAKEVKWDKEGEAYEVSFDLDKIDNSVLMDALGNIVETEVEIDLNQLPTGILDYVKTHYPNKKAKEGAKITDAQGNVTYEVAVKGIDLIFDSTGKFIKEEKDYFKSDINADKNQFNIFITCICHFNIESSDFSCKHFRLNKRQRR